MKVAGNRFARCRTRRLRSRARRHRPARTGPTRDGDLPRGGYYGVAAYYFTDGANVWSDNYWDDNLQPVCISGHC